MFRDLTLEVMILLDPLSMLRSGTVSSTTLPTVNVVSFYRNPYLVISELVKHVQDCCDQHRVHTDRLLQARKMVSICPSVVSTSCFVGRSLLPHQRSKTNYYVSD